MDQLEVTTLGCPFPMLSVTQGGEVTGPEYLHAAKDFQKAHKIAVDRIMRALFEESLARQRGAKLLKSPVKAAIADHCRLLRAMADVGQEFLNEA